MRSREVAKVINDLATMETKGFRFKWKKGSGVDNNVKRRFRRLANKLKLDDVLQNAYRDLLVYGCCKVPIGLK
jgi:hypothetical protein